MISHIQDILALPFIRYAIGSLVIGGIVAGMLGPFILMRRIGFIVGGISHALLGVLGVAFLLGASPYWVAIPGAIALALFIGYIEKSSGKGYGDLSVALVWTVGMSIGVLAMNKAKGYAPDVMSYLFGNVLLLTKQDLFWSVIVALFLIFLVLVFFKKLVMVCIDEDFAIAQGIRVGLYYYLLLVMIGLAVIVLLKSFGIILMISMLIIPSSIASHISRSLGQLWLFTIISAVFSGMVGFCLAYAFDLSVAPVVAIVLAVMYVIALLIKR